MTDTAESAAYLTLSGEADLRPARRAVAEIAAALPFDGRQVADITLAVAEACTNGVRYGTAPDEEPLVVVVAQPADDHLCIDVRNPGHGSAPLKTEMPDGQAESGRGIPLMHALMDKVMITNTGCGTNVRMVKYFSR